MKSGITSLIATLLIAVVVLASSTAYLGFLAMQPKTTGTQGSSALGSGIISSGPSSNVLQASGSGEATPSNAISVSGTGQVTYTPNEALLSLSIVTNNRTAQTATQSDAVATERVIKALNSIGIANSSIQTQGYYLSPNYNNYNYPTQVPSIISYTVTNTLMVNLTSNDAIQLGLNAGKAIDTAVGAGANQVSLQFAASTSMLSGLNREALKQAVSSASAQAQTIASSLGVTISGVVSATEGYSYYPSYQGPYYYNAVMDTVSSPAQVTPIMPGSQTIMASVQVVYSIS